MAINLPARQKHEIIATHRSTNRETRSSMKPNPITTMSRRFAVQVAAERKFAIACRAAYAVHTASMAMLMLREQGDLDFRTSTGGPMH